MPIKPPCIDVGMKFALPAHDSKSGPPLFSIKHQWKQQAVQTQLLVVLAPGIFACICATEYRIRHAVAETQKSSARVRRFL